MSDSKINIFEILLGVLIARIIVLWLGVAQHFTEWKFNYDEGSVCHCKDKLLYKLYAATLSTCIISIIIIVIYSWYSKKLKHTMLSELGMVKI